MASNADVILLKIELEEAKAKVGIKNLTKEVKKLDGRTKEYSLAVKKLALEEAKLNNVQIRRVAHTAKLSKSNKDLSNSITPLNKKLQGTETASGGAATSVLELGRVVSDAPYGIRGMANNVSQLSSNILFSAQQIDKATGKVVGFTGVIKGMGKAFMGPLGILFAIQAVIAAVDFFYGSTKKAEEGVESLDGAAGRAGSNLRILSQSLEAGTLSQEESSKAVKAANEEYIGLNLVLDENNKLTDDSVVAIDSKIEALARLAKAQALQKLVEDQYAKLLPLQIAQSGLEAKAMSREATALSALSLAYKENGNARALQAALSARSAATEGTDAIDKIEKKIQELLKVAGDEGLIDELFKGKSKGKGKTKRNKVDLLGLESVKIGEEAKKAEKVLQAVLSGMQIDKLKVNPLDLNSFLRIDTTLSPEAQAAIKAYNRAVADQMIKESEAEDIETLIKTYKVLMSGVTDFIDGEYDRQLVVEKNKTNAMNEELNNRLLNENLSKDERKGIQNEIYQNDEKLRKKQDIIAKKAFMTSKAFNITMATIDTFSAATKALNDPTPMPTPLRLALVGATIASGLAQVASIARTKFQSSSASTPINTGSGGGSGGGADREFNFNLVGNTQGNQLVDAIQGQFKTPIKAFVVSKDITTQQELDTNIKGSATF